MLEERDSKVLRQTINTNLYLTGLVSEEQLYRLECIANKCPIHKILHKSFNIKFTHVGKFVGKISNKYLRNNLDWLKH